jgi:hypothetical protein
MNNDGTAKINITIHIMALEPNSYFFNKKNKFNK